MVKLARILKSEFRDDVAGGSNIKLGSRGYSNKNRSTQDAPAGNSGIVAAAIETIERNSPTNSGLLNILQTKVGKAVQQQDPDEQRDPPIDSRTPIIDLAKRDPHRVALTRAAQMAAARSQAKAEEDHPSDEREEAEEPTVTMAMIDAVANTSEDPAFVDALESMMQDSEKVQAEEEKEPVKKKNKEEKEPVKKKNESRLQETLKKCAPDLMVGDAATLKVVAPSAAKQQGAMVDVSSGADDEVAVAATPVSNSSTPTHNNGLLNRINRSFTSNSNQNNNILSKLRK